jgi:MarR family 2-MHQ and catechol resistance regulon transcriptional repressor
MYLHIFALVMRIEEEIKQTKFKSEQHKLAINIMFTSNWLLNNNARALKPHGLTTQQFNVLRILKGQYPNPAPVSLLTERMLDKMSNASRLVDKLVSKQLVKRTVCKNDRRQVDIIITEEGKKKLEAASEAVETFHGNFKVVSDSEAKKLNEILDRLRTNGSNID